MKVAIRTRPGENRTLKRNPVKTSHDTHFTVPALGRQWAFALRANQNSPQTLKNSGLYLFKLPNEEYCHAPINCQPVERGRISGANRSLVHPGNGRRNRSPAFVDVTMVA